MSNIRGFDLLCLLPFYVFCVVAGDRLMAA